MPSSVTYETVVAVGEDTHPILGAAEHSLERTVRFRVGDSLHVVLPSGTPYSTIGERTVLTVEDGTGERTSYAFDLDNIGAGTVTVSFKTTGPHYLSLARQSADEEKVKSEPEFCVVEACLQLDTKHPIVPSHGVVMATVISQRLGPFSSWMKLLNIVGRQHFNAVHFTPVQTLGESKSSYAISDHLAVSKVFTNSEGEKGWAEMAVVLEELKFKYRILPLTDLVLNHAASDSAFFVDHPEAGYNEVNSPHLKGAVELDLALKEFNRKVVAGHFDSQGVGKHIENDSQLNRLTGLMEEHCLVPFKLNEWFVVDIQQCCQLFDTQRDKSVPRVNNPEEVAEKAALEQVGTRRNHIILPVDVLSSLASNSRHLQQLLAKTQEKLWARKNEIYQSILNSFRGTVRYERVESKRGPIDNTPWNSLVPWYFTPVRASDGRLYHLANNGWVLDWSAKDDFTAPGALVYLGRKLVAWSDCVKFRYGDSPSSSPALWDMITQYCEITARYFTGVRLDNCHSTPIHVGKYMLQRARRVNPNLFVFAELFTGNQMDDIVFEEELGLDVLVREALQTGSPGDQSWHAFKYSSMKGYGGVPMHQIPLTYVSERGHVPLVRRRCINIFYDCTHDNETPFQKNRPNDALACAAIVAASGCAAGSVLGYEVCLKKNFGVVVDGQTYPEWRVAPVDNDISELEDKTTAGTEGRNEEPEKPLHIWWRSSAQNVVEVWGAFNNWSAGIPMERQGDGGWKATLPNYQGGSVIGKFVVDGRWTTSNDYPKECDDKGNENNRFGFNERTDQPAKWLARKGTYCSNDFNASVGIVEARRILNVIHQRMALQGYNEIKLTHLTDDTCVISRYETTMGLAYHFVVRSYWWKGPDRPSFSEIYIEGRVQDIDLCALTVLDPSAFRSDNPKGIAGENSCVVPLRTPDIRYDGATDRSILSLSSFPSGAVLVLHTELARPDAVVTRILDNHLESAMETITLEQLNCLLWSCEREERDRSSQRSGVYMFPESEEAVFSGFAGVVDALNQARAATWKSRGHNPSPATTGVYKNVMDGDWLLDYHKDRMTSLEVTSMTTNTEGFMKLKDLVRKCSEAIKRSPHIQLKPAAVDSMFSKLHRACIRRVLQACEMDWIRKAKDPLVQNLIIASTQLCGSVPSSRLPNVDCLSSMSAGLPHFTVEYMREWGRDTFIAFNGLYLATGRNEDAKNTILAYASVIRHAMLPNLLDSGNSPRYNARDATWYWLYGVRQYWSHDPSILDCPVKNQYPDQGLNFPCKKLETVGDCVKHILGAHAKGVAFREWNAGERIDAHMKDEGFNISVAVGPDGIERGGNRWNCGTWMDKMGSSDKAGNRGLPSSSRDGGPIEIIGASWCVLKWVVEDLGTGDEELWYSDLGQSSSGFRTYSDWFGALRDNFASKYRIEGDSGFKGVAVPLTYKDVDGGKQADEDYFLRSNYSYAFAMADDIDDPERINTALDIAFDELACEPNQVGMKTLNRGNYRYRPNYDNGDDSADRNTAHGWNYHQGPEWVWPMGAWYQAKALNLIRRNQNPASNELLSKLKNLRKWIIQRPWYSLPELMDSNGRICRDSCQSQAWSLGTFIWFFYILYST